MEPEFAMNYKLVGSAGGAVALAATVVYGCFRLADSPQSFATNLLVITFGAAIGWLLGIVLSPYTREEERRFGDYAKGFAVFASGYLVGKIDKLLSSLLDPEFVLDPMRGFRVMAFLTSLIISLIATFVFRRYG
jgi:hypothetical protein